MFYGKYIDLYKIDKETLHNQLRENKKLHIWGFVFLEKHICLNKFQLQPTVRNCLQCIPPNSIGVHIRRTDNIEAIKNSPSEEFYKVMRKEITVDPNVHFYCASDSKEEIQRLKKEFGERIIVQKDTILNRNSESGIICACVDLFSLSQCKKIIGSYWSAFSNTAAGIHNIPIEIIQRR